MPTLAIEPKTSFFAVATLSLSLALPVVANADSLAATRLAATRLASTHFGSSRLSGGSDVYHSKNQELALYRFGYRSDHRRDPRFSELSGYHLEDEPASVEERLNEEPKSALGRLHDSDADSPAERFNRAVNKASDVLLGGVSLVAQQFLGEDAAYAASVPQEEELAGSVLSRPATARDGLVHF